jgi:hypothetical protein
MVEFIDSECDLFRGDGIEGHLFRKELPNEAVHVLVGAALPRGVGMGKEEVGSKLAGDPLMLCELFAVVGRQRVNTGCIAIPSRVSMPVAFRVLLGGSSP